MRNLLVVCLTLGALSGCAATGVQRSFTERDNYSQPKINVELTAGVGQSIVSNKLVAPAIKINEDIAPFGIAKGETFRACGVSTDPLGIYYCPHQDDYDVEERVREEYTGLFVPTTKSMPVQVYTYRARASFMGWWWRILGFTRKAGVAHFFDTPPVTYEETQVEKLVMRDGKLTRELVYSGVSKNTIFVRYREFIDDVARPAFAEDLKYDISQGEIIGYKEARFQILKATNTEIRFKVISRLE